MDVEQAIRSRRTIKAFEPQPVARETLEELLELARWAPNHNLTNPWRFRVVGPEALERLKKAAGPQSAPTRARAPPRGPAAAPQRGAAPAGARENITAPPPAFYTLLLAAHARGLAG